MADELSASGSSSGSKAPSPPARKRPAHRPKGTTYRDIDRPLHEEMRRMLEQRQAPSLTAAALQIANRAWPPSSSIESRATRLVRTYPW